MLLVKASKQLLGAGEVTQRLRLLFSGPMSYSLLTAIMTPALPGESKALFCPLQTLGTYADKTPKHTD